MGAARAGGARSQLVSEPSTDRQPATIWWSCICGQREHLEPLAIWLHIARCAACSPELRELGQEICWWNWRPDPSKVVSFRRLLLELATCHGEHGCWWCHDGKRAKTRHPETGQYLLGAMLLARFLLLPWRIGQGYLALMEGEDDGS